MFGKKKTNQNQLTSPSLYGHIDEEKEMELTRSGRPGRVSRGNFSICIVFSLGLLSFSVSQPNHRCGTDDWAVLNELMAEEIMIH
jgi:hypothetical protein